MSDKAESCGRHWPEPCGPGFCPYRGDRLSQRQLDAQQQEGIRPYGPGKFDTLLDAYLYNVSLDGCDEEIGDATETGWYGMMRGPFEYDPEYGELNGAERECLGLAGVILCEGSTGFVTVDYYETEKELKQAWGLVLMSFEEEEEEDSAD